MDLLQVELNIVTIHDSQVLAEGVWKVKIQIGLTEDGYTVEKTSESCCEVECALKCTRTKDFLQRTQKDNRQLGT